MKGIAMRKLTIAASVLALVGVGSFACYVSFVGSTMTLAKLFPDVPYDIVWKIHVEMFKEALSGKYKEFEINADEDERMEAIFREKLAKYITS